MDAKSDLMMRKLDEILSGGNPEEHSAPRERSRQQMMETEHAAMSEPSKVRERLTNLSIGSGPGQPIESRLDKPGPAGGGCHPRDTIAHCATNQINARSDYSLEGHNDVCLDV